MTCAAVATPPFPQNGPGLRPSFDGVDLLLLDRATPPAQLLQHMEKLGREFQSPPSETESDAWVEETPEVAALLAPESLNSWDFDLIKLDQATGGKPLALLAFALIQSFGLIERLEIDVGKLKKYLLSFERLYNPCLYHNPMHAADVMHAFCFLLRKGKLDLELEPDELLIALLAGPAHDLGHPGVNNALLIKQKHPVSVRFPTSVLENHHASLAEQLLERPDMDVLSFLDTKPDGPSRKVALRQLLKDLVLYTDMSLHGKIMDTLKQKEDGAATLDVKEPAERVVALQALLHAADLSNPCKKWEIHIQWTHAIVAEFFSQGDLERHLGVDVTPMLDRTLGCGRTSQKGFFVHFIRPLFIACAKVLPCVQDTCEMLVSKLDANVDRWVQLGF